MAKVLNGIAMGFSGSVGNVIFKKQPDGSTNVSQKPAPSDKPFTPKQLSAQQDTALAVGFIKPIKTFIETSFELQGKLEKRNANNTLFSLIRLSCLTGVYPERKVDFSKILVSKGEMPVPENAAVSLNEFGVLFTWDSEAKAPGIHYSDRVMLMAYLPDLKQAKFELSGAQRNEGSDLLSLSGIAHGYTTEIFISFMADDRKSISNSVYLGQLTW